jgi:hypothetical protein
MLIRLFLLLLLLCGCEQSTTVSPPAQTSDNIANSATSLQTKTFLAGPDQATLVETPAEAIPLWRQFANPRKEADKPALLLFSQNPFLEPIPKAGLQAALELAKTGSPEMFREKTSMQAPDPLIYPSMALSLAVQATLFSEIIWVLPQLKAEMQFSPETFRQQLQSSGIATASEATSFVMTDQDMTGTIRQTPVRVILHQKLQTIQGPLVLHFDLSFFRGLYTNEIKTPLYATVYQALTALRDLQPRVAAVSVSLSNVTDDIALQVRFLGDLLTRLIADPQQLEQPLSTLDTLRRDALYLSNFFQNEKRLELFMQMETESPRQAAVQYDLFRIYFELKQQEKALTHLDAAVKLDPIYAREYLNLAEVAVEKKQLASALHMLDLAGSADPQNPFILIRKCELLQQSEHTEAIAPMLETLLRQPWSQLYFPEMSTHLRQRFATTK